MKPETTGKLKFGGWGLVLGAVIAMIIGFSWGGWVTAGTVKTENNEAVVASQAAICVAQFMTAPNSQEKLKEFEELDSWKRADFIKEGGWAIMPGQETGNYAVSKACANGLQLLLSN